MSNTLRVTSFSTTSRAQTYAGDHGLFQVETIVVAFAALVSQAERDRYRSQIQTLVHDLTSSIAVEPRAIGEAARRPMSLQHSEIRSEDHALGHSVPRRSLGD